MIIRKHFEMTRYLTSYFLLFSCMTHFFCCGIPFFLGVISLTTNLSISSFSFINSLWFEKIELHLFFITSIIFLLFFISEIFSRKINCIKDGQCDHPPCDKKKKLIKFNFFISLFFYFFNIVIIFFE